MEKNNKLFKLNRLYHYIFGEKFYKKLDFEWHKYAKRDQIIQEVIYRKSYNSYLEIGCDQNQVFSKIKISKKLELILFLVGQYEILVIIFLKRII